MRLEAGDFFLAGTWVLGVEVPTGRGARAAEVCRSSSREGSP